MSPSVVGLLLLMGVLLLNAGGVKPWTSGLLAAAGGACYFLSLVEGKKDQTGIRQDLLTALAISLWISWILWLCIQTLYAWPEDWLRKVAPNTIYVQKSASELLATPIRYTLSLTPGDSIQGLIASTGLLSVYLAAYHIAKSRKKLNYLCYGLIFIICLEAIYGIWAYFTADDYLSAFNPYWSHASAHGTVANRNHFAGLLNLGTAICLSVLLYQGQTRRHWHSLYRRLFDPELSRILLLRILLVTLILGTLLSQSRMGNLSIAAALLLSGVIWILQTRNIKSAFRATLFFASIAVLDVFLLGSQFGLEKLQDRLVESDIQKDSRVPLNQATWLAIEEHSKLGTGLNSYQTIIQAYRPDPIFPRARHAHNDYLEFLLETGIPGSMILFMILLVHSVMAARMLRSQSNNQRAAAIMSVVAIISATIHAASEFNFRLPAYSTLFVIILGATAGRHFKLRSHQKARALKS